ncbi:MAG: sugar transferase [Agathobacter sp.]|nr:sugar transferase [Agathobacter sp.]
MSGKMKRLTIRVMKIINVALILLPFIMAWFLYYTKQTAVPYYIKGEIVIFSLFIILYVLFAHIYDALLISLNRIPELIYSQALSSLFADAIMFVVLVLLSKRLPAIWPMVVVFLAQIMFSSLWSYYAHQLYFKIHQPRKTGVIYDQREGVEKLLDEYGMDKKFEVVHIESVETCISNNMEKIKDLEVVFLCGIHSHERNIILKYCIINDVQVYVIPRVGDVIMSGAKQMHMLHLPMLRVNRYAPTAEYRVTKRVLDVVVCGIALIVLSPIMLITAVAIKLTDGGPVFYKQCRLTQNGKKFDVLKFRSMRVDAEKDGVARLSTGDKDNRVTAVGKFIRKVRIDELPQLINILKGDMSIVGPRPERPEIAAQYEKELPEFALRLQAKAGLTGYAQVYGKYNTTPYDKLQMDLMYIAKPSLAEDLKIIFATVKIILIPESTEGVAEGQTTASANKRVKMEMEKI